MKSRSKETCQTDMYCTLQSFHNKEHCTRFCFIELSLIMLYNTYPQQTIFLECYNFYWIQNFFMNWLLLHHVHLSYIAYMMYTSCYSIPLFKTNSDSVLKLICSVKSNPATCKCISPKLSAYGWFCLYFVSFLLQM